MVSMRAARLGESKSWGEIGVANPGFWSAVGSVAKWGEIGVANLGFWSAVRRGEFGVTVPGFLS